MEISDVLKFKVMITPLIIQIVFWIGIIVILISALTIMFTQSFFAGVGMLVIGPLFWRIYCEIMIVLFKIYEELKVRNVAP